MKKLNMQAPMGITGYGIVSQYLFRELYRLGYETTLWPKGQLNLSLRDEDIVPVHEAINRRDSGFDPKAPYLSIWHQFDLMHILGKGPYLAYSFFELSPLTPRESLHMNIPDVMCVPSQWAKDITLQVRKQNVEVVPCGVDTDIFKPAPSTLIKRPNPDTYMFFNMGKWEKRKGHDFLANAFGRAFNKSDNVQLTMSPNNMCISVDDTRNWVKRYKDSRLGSKIEFIHNVWPTHQDIANVINSMDCGIFPARAEGWNMELMESMACGKPVITTNVTAHTEYCTKDNAYLIDCPNLEKAYDNTFFFGDGYWHEIDMDEEDQLIEYMRHCYTNRVTTNPEGVKTAEKFSWANSGKILDKIIVDSLQ